MLEELTLHSRKKPDAMAAEKTLYAIGTATLSGISQPGLQDLIERQERELWMKHSTS